MMLLRKIFLYSIIGCYALLSSIDFYSRNYKTALISALLAIVNGLVLNNGD